MIVKIIVEWLALCGAAAEQVPGVYFWWVGVGEVRPPPEPMVLVLRYAIQHRPSITELIQPKVKWLTWIKTIWTLVHVYEYLSRGPLLGSDWYFLFFIPPCHCYLWSTQWGCHATQSVVPAELCSALSTSGTVTSLYTFTNIHEKTTNISTRTLSLLIESCAKKRKRGTLWPWILSLFKFLKYYTI